MELHVFVGNINIFSFAIIKLIKTSVVLFFWGGRGGGGSCISTSTTEVPRLN